MTCSEILKLIPEFVNNELSEAQVNEFSDHLSVCPDCQAALEDYRLIYGKSRLPDENIEKPDLVAITMNRIKAASDIDEVPLAKRRIRWLRPVMIAVPVILIVLILIDFLLWYFPDQPDPSTSTRVVPQPGDELSVTSALLIRLSLDELISSADAIVIGTVTEILPSQRGTFGREQREIIYTDVIIEVDRFLYGEPESEKIAVRVLGGRIGNVASWAEDSAEYELGEDVFLFLQDARYVTVVPEGINPQNYYTTSSQDKYRYWHGIIDNRGDDRFPMCTWFVRMRIAAIHDDQ